MSPVAHTSMTAAQGGIINGYYASTWGSNPCLFIITFGKPAATGVNYCEAYTNLYNQCIPDGNKFKGQSEDVRPPPPTAGKRGELAVKRTGGLYVTESGMEISSSEDLEPGTILMRVPTLNSTMVMSRDWNEGDGDGEKRLFLSCRLPAPPAVRFCQSHLARLQFLEVSDQLVEGGEMDCLWSFGEK